MSGKAVAGGRGAGAGIENRVRQGAGSILRTLGAEALAKVAPHSALNPQPSPPLIPPAFPADGDLTRHS